MVGHGGISPELERALELLADGRWQNYETVVRHLIKVIPPGKAIRTADSLRVAQARKRSRRAGLPDPGSVQRVRAHDLDRVRETGARTIIRKMLTSSRFDVRPATAVRDRQIRLAGTSSP